MGRKPSHIMALGVLLPILVSTPAQADPTTNASAIWDQSLKSESAGDYKTAIDKMQALASVFPDTYLIQVRMGWLSYMNRDYKGAVLHYEQASQISPASLTPFLGLVYTYRAQGLNQNVQAACAELLKRDPENVIALKTLATINYEKTDFATAAHYFQALVDLHPEEPDYLSGAAWSNLKLGNKRAASMFFVRLVILSPDYSYAKQGYQLACEN